MNTAEILRRPKERRLKTGLSVKSLDCAPPAGSFTDEQVTALHAGVVEHYLSFTGTANAILLNDDGISTYRSQACHAFLPREIKEHPYIFLTENAARRTKRVKLTEKFLKFFLSDQNPMSQAILNRDDYDFCRDYGFIISPKSPQPVVMNLCIMSRHFKEVVDEAFDLFNECVDKGIHPWIAYEFCMNSGLSYSKGTPLNSLYGTFGGHRVHCAVGKDGLLKAFQGDITGVDWRTFLEKPSIFGASGLFSSEERMPSVARNNPELQGLIGKSRNVGEKPRYRPPNPFKESAYGYFGNEKRDDDLTKFDYQEGVDVVLPYIQEQIIKELAKYG